MPLSNTNFEKLHVPEERYVLGPSQPKIVDFAVFFGGDHPGSPCRAMAGSHARYSQNKSGDYNDNLTAWIVI